MKRILPVIIVGSFIAFLGSCKKDGIKTPDAAVVGKWQETKLTIQESNGTAVDHDTVFTSISFNTNDYVQFNKDKSAVVSTSGIYNVTGKSIVMDGGTVVSAQTQYTYSIADSTLTLTFKPGFLHPTNGTVGPDYKTAIITQLDADHLALRTYFYTPLPFIHNEIAYYTKVK